MNSRWTPEGLAAHFPAVLQLLLKPLQIASGLLVLVSSPALPGLRAQTPANQTSSPFNLVFGSSFADAKPIDAQAYHANAPAVDPLKPLWRQASQAKATGQYKAAADIYSKIVALNPNAAAMATALEARAEMFAALKQPERADADLKAAGLLVSKTDVGFPRAEYSVYFTEQLHEKALAAIEEAIALRPGDPDFLSLRALAEVSLKKYQPAYDDLTEALALKPEDFQLYINRAQVLNLMDRREEAIDDASTSLILNPRNVPLLIWRASLRQKIGDEKGQVADATTALKMKPMDPDALNEVAWTYATTPSAEFRNGKQAIRLADQACALTFWKSFGVIDTLAASYAEAGEFDLAVAYEERAIKTCPMPGNLPELKARLALYKARKPYRDVPADSAELAWKEKRYRTFMAVWQTVNDTYYDTTFGGVDWQKVRQTYRARLESIEDIGDLRKLLSEMIFELHRTHFAIYPRDAVVFNPSERSRIGDVGVTLAFASQSPFIAGVDAKSPGAAAALQPGDRILKVNEVELLPYAKKLTEAGVSDARIGLYLDDYVESYLSGAVGTKVKLQVEAPDKSTRLVEVTCGERTGEWSEPVGYLPSVPIRYVQTHGGDGIDVIKFNAFVPPIMARIRDFLTNLPSSDGLIIDLRGNRGGVSLMAAGIAGLLSSSELTVGTVHERADTISLGAYPQEGAFLGPVAVLVDRSSLSTSEILAAGLQENHRAAIFGEATAGAALPSLFRVLPTGDLFQYAVGDITTPSGVTIEGHGIVPDHVVERSLADLSAGNDPVASAARAWLAQERLKTRGASNP